MVHAARMTAAGLAAYALVNLRGVSQGLYAMITAIIVTQSSIGGSLKMALEQAAGTLLGALYAPAVMLLVAPADHLTGALALVVALAPLSFLAAFSPGYRAAPSRASSCCSPKQVWALDRSSLRPTASLRSHSDAASGSWFRCLSYRRRPLAP
jgi:hypothetical protein